MTVLLGALVAATWRRPSPTGFALGLALAACAITSAGAVSYNLANAERTKRDVLGPEPSFVDRSDVRDAALLQTRTSARTIASEYLFWNRSVDAVYLLPGAEPPDAFAVTRLKVAPDGTLLAGGEPVTRPLLADGFSDTVRFRSSGEIASSPVYRLLRSDGPQRLALYAPGRYADGWLGLVGSIQLWPEDVGDGLAGTVSFRLTAPAGSPATAVRFEPEGGATREVVVPAGDSREVTFSVCAPGTWRVEFAAPSTGSVGGRFVSVRASEPVYRPDPAAC